MSGTIIITGANSTLAIPAVKILLTSYPTYTLILTVRNTTPNDPNTNILLQIIAQFPQAKAFVHSLNLSSLVAVKEFTTTISSKITNNELPEISSVICNAYAWSISTGLKLTAEGNEVSLAVNHLAHFSLVLRLLGHMQPQSRIVFLGSSAIFPGKNGLEKYPPVLPKDLNKLLKPDPDGKGEEVGRGFYRYGLSKLVVVMCMYELNRRLALQEGNTLKSITALAFDPGAIPASRCMATDVPAIWHYGVNWIAAPLQPLLKLFNGEVNSPEGAARDLVEVAVGKKFKAERGYFFSGLKEGDDVARILGEGRGQEVWEKSLEWVGVGREDTALVGT
ncbi:short-chain dehydrogenase/reductase-like protein sdr [Halenospora varia]|nr:short-chain dehydrogenase/reductase-like protein sdr [Halenospora varia]